VALSFSDQIFELSLADSLVSTARARYHPVDQD
jgi:hypothetical protein